MIELHTWNATTRDTTRPDRIVFDLDPGEGVTWKQIQEGTELTRALLEELGLASFLKTSGGKGLHVIVPIAPKDDWDTVKALAKAIVEHMATIIPDRFVAKSGAKNRVGRIFVDYLRNGFGATTACAWSARARPGLGVSVPCSLGRARRAHRRRPLDDPQPARADRGARRSVARLCEDAADADEGGEDAGRVLTAVLALSCGLNLECIWSWHARRAPCRRRDADGAAAPADPVRPSSRHGQRGQAAVTAGLAGNDRRQALRSG